MSRVACRKGSLLVRTAGLAIAAVVLRPVVHAGSADRPLAPFMANPSAEKPYGRDAALGFSKCTRDGSQYRWTEDAARTGDMGVQMVFKKDQGKTYGFLTWSGLDLSPDRLYRFAVHYRTHQDEPRPRMLRVWGGDCLFHYPSARDWTRAQTIFAGKKDMFVRVDTHAVKDGAAIRAKEGATDNQGRFPLLNRIDLTIDLDDFDLRELAGKDFEGNLVENGGFEAGEIFPVAWEPSPHRGGALDNTDPHSGHSALRLDVPADAGVGMHSNTMPMKRGTIYVVSLWMKTRVLSSDTATLCLAGGRGTSAADRWWERRATPTTEWQSCEFYIETPVKGGFGYRGEQFISRLTLSFATRKAANSLWIDDVEVYAME